MNTIVTVTAPATTFTGAKKGTFPALASVYTEHVPAGLSGTITPRTNNTLFAQQMVSFANAHKKYVHIEHAGDLKTWKVVKEIPCTILNKHFEKDNVKIDLFGQEGVGVSCLQENYTDVSFWPTPDYQITWVLSEEANVVSGGLLTAIENVMRGQKERCNDVGGQWYIVRTTRMTGDGKLETHYLMTGRRYLFLDGTHGCMDSLVKEREALKKMLKSLWTNRIKVFDYFKLPGVGYSQTVQEALNGTKTLTDLSYKLDQFPTSTEDVKHLFNIINHPLWKEWEPALAKWKDKKHNKAFVSAAYTERDKQELIWLENHINTRTPLV